MYFWAQSDIELSQALDEYYMSMIIMCKTGYDLDAVSRYHMNQKIASDEILALAQQAPKDVLVRRNLDQDVSSKRSPINVQIDIQMTRTRQSRELLIKLIL